MSLVWAGPLVLSKPNGLAFAKPWKEWWRALSFPRKLSLPDVQSDGHLCYLSFLFNWS